MTDSGTTTWTPRRRCRALHGSALTLLAACLLTCALTEGPVRGQQFADPQREYNVKAVTLYAFGRYVTWPESAFADPQSPFVIGVLGNAPVHQALQTIAAKKTINSRTIIVRKLEGPEDCAKCHIAFVTIDEPPETEAKLIAAASGQPVLLVGERPGFLDRGGIVNFVNSNGKVQFELSPENGDAAHLSLDAKLLSLSVKPTLR